MESTRKRRKSVYLILIVLAIIFTMACSIIPSAPEAGVADTTAEITVQPSPEASEEESPPVLETPAPPIVVASEAEGLQETLTRLYREINPSVVYIVVSTGSRDFTAPLGSGSGFVFAQDDEGAYIVTNDHVVAPGSRYEVVFATGDRQRGEVIGSDPDSDLAVVKIEDLPEGVAPLALGDGASLAVGQLVIAIGNPFGEQGSMSLGIISGLGRSLPSQRMTASGSTYSLPQVIQTDAPINPGNSGGPLLNLDGEVIGVNAAIATTTGINSGVGFSIPVDVVERIVPSLIEDGEVVYPFMGLTFDGEVSLDEMETYGVSQTQGAYVLEVSPGSPAAEAGLVGADPDTLRGGDLIVAIDDRPVGDFSDLNTYLVLETEVGQTIDLTVLRGDERLVLPLTLGARP
ncbi:MAG: S1C family serine protease [Anaerolineae bacterium]